MKLCLNCVALPAITKSKYCGPECKAEHRNQLVFEDSQIPDTRMISLGFGRGKQAEKYIHE